MSKHDDVNNPAHYDLFPGQQVIDIIQASLTAEEFAGYCKGNALKYRLRAGEKGDAAQDLAKANWYRDRLRGGKEGGLVDVHFYCANTKCSNRVYAGSRYCPKCQVVEADNKELPEGLVGYADRGPR